jgi:branched-chain amino acid transport system substrate-binding protein
MALGVAVLGLASAAVWRGTQASPAAASPTATPSASASAPAPCVLDGECPAGTLCTRTGACVAKGECSSNAECTHAAGKVSACNRAAGKCALLEMPGCRIIDPSNVAGNDATFWIPVIVPDLTEEVRRTTELALRDFGSVSGGLPPRAPGDAPHPMAAIYCIYAGSSAPLVHHFVEEVGVPAIIGWSDAKELVELTTSVLNTRDVLAITFNKSPLLSSLPTPPNGPRLVWRIDASTTSYVGAMAALIGSLVKATAERPRVALIRGDYVSGVAMSDALVSELRVHGKTIAEGGAELRNFVLPTQDPTGAYDATTKAVVDYAPDAIVDNLNPPANAWALFGRIEEHWPSSSRRPIHVVYPAPMLQEQVIQRWLRARPDARGRIFAVDTRASTPANTRLALRYNEFFSPAVTPETTQGIGYDAMYLLSYAAASLERQPVTGTNLARAISRLLPPGEPIDVGPTGILQAFKILKSGRNIDLAGTTTTLDFDLDTGDAPAEMSILCPKKQRTGDFSPVESGLFFDQRTRRLTGTLSCP